jgi:hypothetical protein
MLRRTLVVLLMLILPLANASAAVMGMPGYGCTSSPAAQAADAAGDCSHHSARHASAHYGPAGDHAAQDAHCPDHASPEGSSSHAGCGHCDFCLAALGAPNADPAHQGGLVTSDRPAGRASALTSAFLETPRRPPSR